MKAPETRPSSERPMLKRDVGHLANYILRAIQSGSVRQLRERNEVALVLCRTKPVGTRETRCRDCDEALTRSRVQSRLRGLCE